jgi:replication factor A1
MLEYSQETTDTVTPVSKRVYADNPNGSDQASASKKVCIEPVDLYQSNDGFGEQIPSTKIEDYEPKEAVTSNDLKSSIAESDSTAVGHPAHVRNGSVAPIIVKKEWVGKKGPVRIKVEKK